MTPLIYEYLSIFFDVRKLTSTNEFFHESPIVKISIWRSCHCQEYQWLLCCSVLGQMSRFSVNTDFLFLCSSGGRHDIHTGLERLASCSCVFLFLFFSVIFLWIWVWSAVLRTEIYPGRGVRLGSGSEAHEPLHLLRKIRWLCVCLL